MNILKLATKLALSKPRIKQDMESDRFKSLSKEEQTSLLNACIQKEFDWLSKVVTRLEEKDINLYLNHTFHPQNKTSRKIFEGITGIVLPKGVKDTQAIVRAYIGEEKFIARDKELAEQAEAEQLRLANERRLKCLAIATKVAHSENVSGEELFECAKFLGINVPPSTAGMLKKRVISINGEESRRYGKSLSNTIYDIYAECKNKAIIILNT